MSRRVLVVEDDEAMLQLLLDDLEERGFQVTGASNYGQALSCLEGSFFDAIVTDLNLGQGTGLQLTQAALDADPDVPVILITAFGTMQMAIEAVRRGAYDFLTKPFEFEQLGLALGRATDLRRLRKEVALRSCPPEVSGFLIGQSLPMRRVLSNLEQIAPTRATVLLQGESGTGKTLIARTIHEMSPRARGPLVVENIASIPEHLLESELFGHTRGAFTGALEPHKGLFQRAHGGTLVLDEIGELPLALQAKLLRALEDRQIRPVGSDREIVVDVRLIAATNRDLEQEVQEGRFRKDLFFRLAVAELEIPPLRERGRDILQLAHAFLREASEDMGKPIEGFTPESAAILLSYPWPGNIRELKNCIEQAVIMARLREITPAALPERIRQSEISEEGALVENAPAGQELETLEEVEKRHILRVLRAVEGNKAKAARVLGLGRKTLYRKLEAWGLDEV
ncbi:MAG: sigma-54-dependent Fis family transcriptional regulator [Myxococcales bacterium]|nr:sigma-54-dependent Fis family transcriptional regulator [Myxococcales bacterium]